MPQLPSNQCSSVALAAGRGAVKLGGLAAVLALASACLDEQGALGPSGPGGADAQSGADAAVAVDAGADAGVLPDAEVTDAGSPDVPPPPRPEGRSLAAGIYFSCARAADRTVECWGSNERGRLGVGDLEPREGRVTVQGLSDVLEISAGVGHTCARRTDGSVWCWGRNENGALGDGTQEDRSSPVQVVGLAGIDHISAGSWHTCALDEDGRVWCWGRNTAGQAGDPAAALHLTPVEIADLSGVVELAGGLDYTCARLEDATVKCWGEMFPRTYGATPVAIEGLSGVRSLAGAGDYACALRTDGSAWCWGANTNGELGDGTRTHRSEPTRVVELSTAEQASAGAYTAVLRSDGRVVVLGHGFAMPGVPRNPTPIPDLFDVVEVVVGSFQVCVRRADFEVRCVGTNTRGEAGACCFGHICNLPEGAACGSGPDSLGVCTDGWCSDCGAEDQVCCAASRPAGERCRSDRTQCDDEARCTACGGLGEPCCPGGCRDAGAVCFEDACVMPGAPGGPCIDDSTCNQGCCTLTDHSTRLCIAAGQTCPGQPAGACTAAGSCGPCGGVGQPCCASPDSSRVPRYCSAPDTACQQDVCAVQ